MNNKEFITALAEATGYKTKDVEQLTHNLIELMGQNFEQGDPLVVTDFGSFEVKKKLERIIVNPSTQQRMLVPPKLVLNFRPAVSTRKSINQNQ